jgi:FkbM family methyltransferase
MNLLKSVFLRISRKYKRYQKINIKCHKKWFGNTYGGFYVCPDLLTQNSIVYSFGIGEDISFDNAIIEQFGCSVYGFDPTPKSIRFVKNLNTSVNFIFFEFGIGKETGKFNFYLPKNPNHVSGSIVMNTNVEALMSVEVELRTLNDIVNELGHKKIDVLKMDIEGSEFIILESIFDANIHINQILIEFHDRFVSDGKKKLKQAERLLKSKGFEIFALSESLEEVSFINKQALKTFK